MVVLCVEVLCDEQNKEGRNWKERKPLASRKAEKFRYRFDFCLFFLLQTKAQGRPAHTGGHLDAKQCLCVGV
jgi:hypothetical protein